MSWEPTNANDVRLTVSVARRDDDGNNPRAGPTLGASGSVVVDQFSIDSSGNLDPLHGLSNVQALGMSQGNIEHEFSFTVMGEYYNLLQNIRRDAAEDSDDPRSIELFIVARWQNYRTVLEGAYIEETNSSVSDGETAEHEFSGYALRRDPRQNN